MGFEVFKPGSIAINPLGPEEVSLSRGRLNVPAELLDRVGITNKAVVMGDRETKRIAVREPRTGEPAAKVIYQTSKRTGAKRRGSIWITSALRGIGVDPNEAAGRFEATVKHDLIAVGPLGELPEDGEGE